MSQKSLKVEALPQDLCVYCVGINEKAPHEVWGRGKSSQRERRSCTLSASFPGGATGYSRWIGLYCYQYTDYFAFTMHSQVVDFRTCVRLSVSVRNSRKRSVQLQLGLWELQTVKNER